MQDRHTDWGRALVRSFVVGIGVAVCIGAAYSLLVISGSNESSVDTSESQTPLKVMSYSSFVASWGPGPDLVREFEKKTGVKVQLIQADDAGLLLKRLETIPADIVVGLDPFFAASNGSRPSMENGWMKHGLRSTIYPDPYFLAFDWSPVGFVYRQGEVRPPTSLDDLLDSRFREAISLQDPRTSAPGFQFFEWVTRKDESGWKAYFQKLKPNIQSVSGSWSQSYGIFTRGLAKLGLSYATSPLYHRLLENDDRYRFAELKEGAPLHIELAAIPANCVRCDEALLFVRFLLEVRSQQILMKKNWMLPVVEDALKSKNSSTGEAVLTEGERLAFASVYERFRPLINKNNVVSQSRRDDVLKNWLEVGR